EGMATFFEAPDLRTKSGWNTAGSLNAMRLQELRRAREAGKKPALPGLVSNDDGFTYADAWAFTYYLEKRQTLGYYRFLRTLQKRKPFDDYPSDARLDDFRKAFGATPEQMQPDYERYVARTLLPIDK
ncbi:MAG: DUF1570 domain-containing protein, partial [Planctomycetia bacterium]